MGVKDLWQILEPVRERVPLSNFDNDILAVDLGFWVCQMQTAVNSTGTANSATQKIYLRNLFFRIWALLQRSIRLFLVTDGKAPDIKMETIRKRLQSANSENFRFPTKNANKSASTRSRFTQIMKECAELIRLMGLSVLEVDGEAEASCASLNQDGLVSGVLTDDSDAFLYGATMVLRNFNLDGKEPYIDCYKMENIEAQLGLDRQKLICFALLCGCDFGQKGLPGIGKETALRFLEQYSNGFEALERLRNLKDRANFQPKSMAESQILRSFFYDGNFPNEKIVREFESERMVPINAADFSWAKPDFQKFTAFMCGKLEWTMEYCIAKLVPLMTLWSQKSQISQDEQDSNNAQFLEPICIVKKRVRNGKEMLEIQWKKLAEDSVTLESTYVTLESRELIERAYPQLYTEFTAALEDMQKFKRRPSKKNDREKSADQVPTLPSFFEQAKNQSTDVKNDGGKSKEDGENLSEEEQELANNVNSLDDSLILISDQQQIDQELSFGILGAAAAQISSPEKNYDDENCHVQILAENLDKICLDSAAEEDRDELPLMERLKLRIKQ